MARISADGQDYTATWSLGTQANLTVCAWVKIVTDRNDYSTIFSVDNGTGDNWLMQTGADGTTMSFVGDATTQQGIGSMTVGTWYFIALATAGASGTIYYRTAATQTMSTVAVTGVTASVNAVNFRIGDSPWGAEWWNGCINSVKAWTAQLSAAEVVNEAQQYVPLRTANLVAFHPLVQPETADYSGNNRTLSGGTGATREDGPPIPWRMTAPRLIIPASVVGAAEQGAATVGLTASATAVKVAKVSGVCSMGMAVSSVPTKRAAVSGPATVGFAGTGTAKKVAPAVGRATTGLAATGTAAKKTPQAGAATVGLSATRAEVTARAQGGTTALGVSATGVAAKRAPARGTATLGLSSTRAGVIVRAVAGVCSLGLGGSSAPRKTAVSGGLATLGPAGTVLQRKRAVAVGSCSLGTAPRGSAVKRAVLAGRTTVGGSQTSTPAKTARGRGTATLGLCSTHLSVILPVPVLITGGQVRTVWVSDDPPVSVWRAGRTVQSTWRVDP